MYVKHTGTSDGSTAVTTTLNIELTDDTVFGKLAAGAAEGLVTGIENTTKSIEQFSTVGFAQKIVNEVTKLLEIATLPLGDAAKFVATMGLIGAGLVAFSLGKGAAGAAEAINRIAGIGQEGSGKSFAEKISWSIECAR